MDTLRDVRGGAVIDDLTEVLRTLVTHVVATGGSGTLTLTLKVKKAAKGQGNTLLISDDIKAKLPKPEATESVLFATDDGDLQRNDPRQPRLTGMDAKDRVVPHPAAAGAQEATS